MATRFSDRQLREAAIAANRLGLGARPGDLPEIAQDPRGWALSQIQRPIVSAAFTMPDSMPTFMEIRAKTRGMDPEARKKVFLKVRKDVAGALGDNLVQVAASDQSFHERLVWFWLNHFTVSITRRPVALVMASYRRDAIEPFVTGRFEDMLMAVARHPAMLAYLDNHASIGPNSSAGRQRKVGLNENYARETLELHTVGVEGGYDQDDVIDLAKILTGWMVDRRGKNGPFFTFGNQRHEPGPKRVMGKVYGKNETGIREGEAVLRDLANRPETARLISFKLARHFISDNPPADVVARLADVFISTRGDLREMYRVLVNSPEVWEAERRKLRTPFEFVIATGRALGVGRDHGGMMSELLSVQRPDWGKHMMRGMGMMGQLPFRALSPKGWPDEARYWSAPDAVVERIQWAHQVGKALAQHDASVLSEQILGPDVSRNTQFLLRGAESPAQGVALFLSSPEFQRR